MAIDREVGLSNEAFAGSGRIFSKESGSLVDILRKNLIRDAKDRVRGRNLADLTDSSAGAAGIVMTAATTDIVTLAVGSPMPTGAGPFRLTTDNTLPAGLAVATDYWVIRLTATTYKLASSYANAIAGTVVDITDTGTGNHAMQAVGVAPRASAADVTDLTTSCTAATVDTSADTVMDAMAVLMERVNLIRVLLSAGSLDVGPGTIAASGTVAAFDVDVAVNSSNTTGTTFASWRAIEDDLLAAQRTLVDAINEVRAMVGLAGVPVAGEIGGTPEVGLDINQGAAIANAVTTTATTIANAALETEVEAFLAVLQDNAALFCDLLDDVTNTPSEILVTMGPVFINASDFADGSDVAVISPVSGRIRSLRTMVVDEDVSATTPNVTIDVAGSAVSGASVAIGSASAIGVTDYDAVADSGVPAAATGNFVARGQTMNVQTDADATTGACLVWIEIAVTDEDVTDLAAMGHDSPIDHYAV